MSRAVLFTAAAWDDYTYWQGQDKKTLKRINVLIKDAMRNPEDGIGKSKELRESLSGFWSRRIDNEHRLIYKIEGNQLLIAKCRFHYD